MEFVRELGFVAAGGAIGSALRYAVGVWSSQRIDHGFPWHTFAVNIVGAFLLGVLMSAAVERGGWGSWQLFAGVGLLGGFTTFSTFSVETLRLIENGLAGVAAANAIGSVVLGLAAAAVGVAVGRTL